MQVHAYVYLQLNNEVHSLSQQQNVTGQAVAVLELQSDGVGFGVCSSCIKVHLAVWLQEDSIQTETSQN